MIAQFSDPIIPPIVASGLFGLLSQQAQLHPNKVYCYELGKNIRYDEMCQSAARLADRLKAVTRDNQSATVAVAISERQALLRLIWAALKAGVCLAFMPESADAVQIQRLMAHLATDVLLTDNSELDGISGSIYYASLQNGSTDCLSDCEEDSVTPETPAFIFQTSGTTGRPKLIQVTHGQFAVAINSMLKCGCLNHAIEQVAFITPPLFHSYGLSALLEYTTVGASIVLPPEKSALGAVGDLMDEQLANRITAIEAVPHFYAQLVRLLRRVELPVLRHVGLGGGKLELSVIEQLKQRFPQLSYSVRYGLTETPSVVSHKGFCFPYGDDWHSSGKVLPIYDVRIMDGQGHVVTQGQQGEIQLKGAALAWPYVGESADSDYFATGDLGYLDATGELHIVGRNSLFIKTLGYRISPETVETAIRSCTGVIDCRARGVDGQVSAEILPTPHFNKQHLLTELQDKLPSYAIPTIITTVESIPRTPSGKIIRY